MSKAELDREAMQRAQEENRCAHEAMLLRVDAIEERISEEFGLNEFTTDELCDLGISWDEADCALQTLRERGRIRAVGLRTFMATPEEA